MRLGVDLGGTKTEVVAIDDRGRERLRRRLATPAGDYPGTLACIATLVEEAERALGARSLPLGIGIPGSPSPASGLIRNANSTWLNGRPLQNDLEARLGRQVRIANDADCFALSEASDGAARGARIVFGVILGTGVGGGIVVDGRLLEGANAIAGEWGHNPLPGLESEPQVPCCWCGRKGCIETFLSGPALAADHARANGTVLTTAEIAQRAATGNAACAATLERYAGRLARALASVINLLDPEVIVLGGGLSNLEMLYSTVPRLWARHVFSDIVRTRLVRAHHGDSSGVRGAARLWPSGDGVDAS